MKLIGIQQALSGVTGSAEEIDPEKGVAGRDMLKELVKRYKPAAQPGIQQDAAVPAFPAFPPFVLSSCTLEKGGAPKIAFEQLQVMPHLVGVHAHSTEDADVVLEDVVGLLNDEFSFRIAPENTRKIHFTIAVVEFDPKISAAISKLKQTAALLEKIMPGDSEKPVIPKKISFGRYNVGLDAGLAWETMYQSDFVIEARVGTPLEQNRFFCAAPLATKVFLEALRSYEKILADEMN